MTFTIITHVSHIQKDGKYYAYEPYVKEMNLWLTYVDKVIIVAPLDASRSISNIDISYEHEDIDFRPISSFNVLTWKSRVKALFAILPIMAAIFKASKQADHLHLRCPGNIGLLGSLVQVFFPKKVKTIKYAGNWDPKAKQPKSYNFQKRVLSNTFFTKNASVLAYGVWENQTKNIVPFFTASFSKEEITKPVEKKLSETIKLIYVGSFLKSKQPMYSLKVAETLVRKGEKVTLDMYGDGVERQRIESYVQENCLENIVNIHGNQPKETIKQAYKESHFLIFISKSEGWPKVVAESMFFSCLPISSKVSCVPYMLGNGERGSLVDAESIDEVVTEVLFYTENQEIYNKKLMNAREWSQKYTLEYFTNEIKKFLDHE
tara:strand:+ start:38616 stop:39743 length:1128 start_codon:yes stop_codon:yes gene_type:complete